MRLAFAVVSLLGGLAATQAFAQQQASPELQAYGNKLMSEISAGLECSKMGITLRLQVDSLNAEVRRLKDKYEPAKAGEGDPPKP